ncbi:hypothetical protein [Paenibacillus terrigena]|uniref:hypothetical protein n=1 Tax=Paenibacillus terrigena TaxID=369333 RepID=UPI0003731398|nr:hypothetical protein [Paenibacillus terrigena]
MKMTAFMIGGVLGAAAAVYISNNKQMMMAKAGDMGQSVNDWMSKAKDKVIEVTLSPAFGDATASSATSTMSSSSQAPSSSASSTPSSSATSSFASSTMSDTEFGSDQSSGASASSHTQLKDLINKSASVKREVDAILKENNTSL